MTSHRILMAGEFWFGATGAGLAQGLRALGHMVTEVSQSYHFMTGGGLTRRALGRAMTYSSIASYRRELLETARRERSRILLAVKGSYLSPEFLEQLRDAGVLLINYYPDVSFSHGDFTADWLRSYDLVATTKNYHLPWLADHLPPDRFVHVAHGYSSLVHRRSGDPGSDKAFDWDICHVGIASPAKIRWLSGIARHHPGRSILIAGNGWNGAEIAGQLDGCSVQGALLGDIYARTIERSRINLAIHYGPAGPQGWEDTISTRSFEIPACGGFMLHIDSEEVRSLYRPGEEIGVFATTEEMHARIAHHLDRPDERIAIAAAGHRRAVPAYSYDARAAELMALIEARLE